MTLTHAELPVFRAPPGRVDSTLPSRLWLAIRWLAAIPFIVALGCVPFLIGPAGAGLGGLLLCCILNLFTGVGLLAWFGYLRGDSPAALRLVFYAFTAPAWFFLVWFARDLRQLFLSVWP